MSSRITITAAVLMSLWLSAAGALAQQSDDPDNKTYVKDPAASGGVPGPAPQPAGWMQIPMPPKKDWRPNTMMPSITPEAKMNAAQSALFVNPLGLRDMINMMAAKKKVAEGISFEEVVESMDVRANALNMKKVGHNTPYKILREIGDKNSPRVEIISYCDLPTMREILDFVPEFIIFLPCRISVLEDADGQIWILTLDWDVRWLDTSQNPNRISKGLRERAVKIRENLESIMEAGASGDL